MRELIYPVCVIGATRKEGTNFSCIWTLTAISTRYFTAEVRPAWNAAGKMQKNERRPLSLAKLKALSGGSSSDGE